MSGIYTTEITSEKIKSDNPLHQRLLKPYVVAREWVHRRFASRWVVGRGEEYPG